MQPRINRGFEDVLQQAVLMEPLNGVVTAWAFLHAHGVPAEIIGRVLGEATNRRSTDVPASITIEK